MLRPLGGGGGGRLLLRCAGVGMITDSLGIGSIAAASAGAAAPRAPPPPEPRAPPSARAALRAARFALASSRLASRPDAAGPCLAPLRGHTGSVVGVACFALAAGFSHAKLAAMVAPFALARAALPR